MTFNNSVHGALRRGQRNTRGGIQADSQFRHTLLQRKYEPSRQHINNTTRQLCKPETLCRVGAREAIFGPHYVSVRRKMM